MPVPTQGRGGHPCFCTRQGESPRGHAEACRGACDAQACSHTSASSHAWGDRGRGARSARRPPAWATPAAGAHVRTHARTRCTPVWVPPASPAARSRGPGAGSRARAARRVRERALARAVRSAGARPSRTEKPARPPPRRSLGKQRGPAPVGLLRAQSLPPRTAPGGGCSCTGRGTDASSRGQGCFWSVGDVSQGPGGN